MAKCWWCHKEKELYAFNLCVPCYRWFHRHKTKPIEYCEICGKVIMKSQKGICKGCKMVLEQVSKVPRRIEILDNKYRDLKPILDKFESDSQAFTYLEHFFKPKQKKLLEILIERYYHQDRTLDEIGKKRGVTREYIRQCEDKAIETLKRAMSFEDEEEKKFEDLI